MQKRIVIEQSGTGDTMEDSPEPVAPVVAVDAEAITDPEDTIPVSYLHILANAQ